MRARAPLLFTAFIVAVGLAAAAPAVATAKVRRGDRAAKFVSVKDARGKKFSLDKYKKHVVVLTFGASWCVPCKKELPAYEKLARQYKGKKVLFLAVNIDQDAGKGKKFMKQAGLKAVRALYDPKGSTIKSYDPPKMPTTYVITRGVVKHMHGGYSAGDEDSIGKVVDKELARL